MKNFEISNFEKSSKSTAGSVLKDRDLASSQKNFNFTFLRRPHT
jgi:hypothetical protein